MKTQPNITSTIVQGRLGMYALRLGFCNRLQFQVEISGVGSPTSGMASLRLLHSAHLRTWLLMGKYIVT